MSVKKNAILILILISIFFVACQEEMHEKDNWLQEANALGVQAVEALDADPMGAAQFFLSAIETYQKVLVQDSLSIPAIRGIGEAYYLMQDYPKALPYLLTLKKMDTASARNLFELSMTQFNLREVESARENFILAVESANQLNSTKKMVAELVQLGETVYQIGKEYNGPNAEAGRESYQQYGITLMMIGFEFMPENLNLAGRIAALCRERGDAICAQSYELLIQADQNAGNAQDQ